MLLLSFLLEGRVGGGFSWKLTFYFHGKLVALLSTVSQAPILHLGESVFGGSCWCCSGIHVAVKKNIYFQPSVLGRGRTC